MFWDKGYAPSQNIEVLLEKENVTVEEFLDDEDILQECKTQKKNLINYFTRPDVIKRLVEFIITEPSEELPMTQRFRHANMACEILTLGLPSLDEKILSDADTLKSLYSYLENEPPLNPLLSSFFSKTFSMLFTKKAEQDWFLYQQMCLQLLEYIKSQNNFLDLVCKHFATPVIPDLLMQMLKDVEGGALKRNLYEWLTKDKLVERLINILGNPQENDKHANAAEFLCDLIQQGRIMRQSESENDSFEPAFNGSNPILQVIESEATLEALMNVILEPNAQESAIVSGISVVLTLIKPVVFVDEPNSDRLKMMQNREKDIHEQILETVIHVIAPRLKDFNQLLRNPPNKPDIVTTAAKLSPPFGMTRLQICRVFTVLLQTRNEEVTKAICETDFFETLLNLFKQYCWNNFLHSEVEKCLQLIFYTNLSNNNSTQGSTIVNDGSFNKNNSGDNNLSILIFGGGGNGDNIDIENRGADSDGAGGEGNNKEISTKDEANEDKESNKETDEKVDDDNKENDNLSAASKDTDAENNSSDTTAVPTDTGPSVLQTHVIAQCKIVSLLIDCWQHNKELQSAEKGRRLGFMGHLIRIFKHITTCISEFEHIGALIENNLCDSAEVELWQSIINPNDGDFTQALVIQNKMLANCNAHEAADYSQHLPKEFLDDNLTSDYINDFTPSLSTTLDDFKMLAIDPSTFDQSNGLRLHDVVFALDQEMKINRYLLDNDDKPENDLDLFQFARSLSQDDDDDDDDDNTNAGNTGHSLFFKPSSATSVLHAAFGVTSNPWDTLDPFNNLTSNSNDIVPANATPWATDFPSDNFADFDAHFSSFTNDLGECMSAAAKSKGKPREENTAVSAFNVKPTSSVNEEYDDNANVEKSAEEFAKFEDDENAKNEKVAAAASRLLGNDSEDDYEDDDGIWTKPVGSAANHTDEGDEKIKDDETFEAITKFIPITNGPSTKPTKDNDNEKLNNLNDITVTTNDAAADEFKTKISNASAEEQQLKNENDADDIGTDKKIASNVAAVNTLEIAPTS